MNKRAASKTQSVADTLLHVSLQSQLKYLYYIPCFSTVNMLHTDPKSIVVNPKETFLNSLFPTLYKYSKNIERNVQL